MYKLGKETLKKSLVNKFQIFCEKNKFEKNTNQINLVKSIDNFLKQNKSFLGLFNKSKRKCFYLFGGVGVGKTMIMDFVFESLNLKKKRTHFNQFMINFHDFNHQNKDKKDPILGFVNKLKKYDLIYLDEFQVTNIVDAMILGRLFKEIFKQKILVFASSNTTIDDLYKDGLQREQFIPFIEIFKKNSIVKELNLYRDFRKLGSKKLKRVFHPINEKTSFKCNKYFRELTKNKKKEIIKIKIKGRVFVIKEFFEGIARFDFKNLCDRNVGSEDYLEVVKKCKFIFIENIPKFTEYNSNQQNRFINLIDIIYENKIPLFISLDTSLSNIGSSKKLIIPFKRTLSRLYELTSPDMKI